MLSGLQLPMVMVSSEDGPFELTPPMFEMVRYVLEALPPMVIGKTLVYFFLTKERDKARRSFSGRHDDDGQCFDEGDRFSSFF